MLGFPTHPQVPTADPSEVPDLLAVSKGEPRCIPGGHL